MTKLKRNATSNTWPLPFLQYTASIIDWTQAELDILDRKTRKLMTMNHFLHARSDIDRLYFARSKIKRGLLQVNQTLEEEKHSLNYFITHSKQ